MKKLVLCLLPLLLLTGCGSKNKYNTATEKGKYTKVYVYDDVDYSFDDQMRCNVHWVDVIYPIAHTCDDYYWCVYLTGFYFEDKEYSKRTFYVCEKSAQTYDYYLHVIG